MTIGQLILAIPLCALCVGAMSTWRKLESKEAHRVIH